MKLQANVCIVVAVRLCNFSKILKECLAPEILGAIVRMEVASTSSLKTGTFYFLAIVFWLIFPSSSHSFATKIICCLKSQFLSSHWPFLGYLVTFRSFCLLGPISLYFLAHSVSLQQTQLLTTTWTCFTDCQFHTLAPAMPFGWNVLLPSTHLKILLIIWGSNLMV